MKTAEFKAQADAIDAQYEEETSEARSAFEEATAEARLRRQQRLAELAEEFRHSLGDGEPIDQQASSDEAHPEPEREAEFKSELPLSKTGRVQRGVLPRILKEMIREMFPGTFTKTELFEATKARYPNSPIKRGSIIGTVNRFHEDGLLELVTEEPEQTYTMAGSEQVSNPHLSPVALGRFRGIKQDEEEREVS